VGEESKLRKTACGGGIASFFPVAEGGHSFPAFFPREAPRLPGLGRAKLHKIFTSSFIDRELLPDATLQVKVNERLDFISLKGVVIYE
jgi:hypothetical protein